MTQCVSDRGIFNYYELFHAANNPSTPAIWQRQKLLHLRRSLKFQERQFLAELPRTQMHQAGWSLAIANGRLVVRTGLTATSYMRVR